MLEATQRILSLTLKELLAIFKDPRGRFTLFVPPIFQCLIFGYAASYNLNLVPYAVLDQDRSAASQEFLAQLDGTQIFRRTADLESIADLNRYIDQRRALVVLQIGQDFERNLMQGKMADVQIIADGRNSNTAGTAVGYLDAIVQSFNADWRQEHGLPPAPVRIETRAWFNPNLETRWNMVPSMIGTLTMLQTLLLTALSVARERENGTFDQLLVTPIRPFELLVGKALPSLLIGMVQATTILLVAQLWFHIPFAGSFVTLYFGFTLFLLAAVGIGLLISSVVGTMQQALLFTFVLVLPFTLLSGLTTPVSSMPEILQQFTLINPLRYAIDQTLRIYLEGARMSDLIGDFWPLALIAAITLSASTWMFRHRLA
jgi:ABC-2 type transport system permease protein